MQSANGTNREAGAKLLKLALALYRQETTKKPDAELSEDMLLLLHLASGDTELMAWAMRITGAAAEEVRRCCIAFIERELFTERTDPYGVLGLNPWAAAATIKEHYRLLIRLFHPDRGLVNAVRAETYAAMINEAYASLKNLVPIDSANAVKVAPAVSFRANPVAGLRRKSADAGVTDFDAWAWLSWITPAKALFCIAMLAILIVAMLLQKESRPSVNPAAMTGDTSVSLPYFLTPDETAVSTHDAELHAVLTDDKSISATIVAPISAAPMPVNKAVAMPVAQGAQTTLVTPAKQSTTSVVAARSTSGLAVAKPDAGTYKPAQQEMPAVVQQNHENSPDLTSLPASANDHGQALHTPEIQSYEAPTDRELHDLIASFMDSYHRGDVSEFMQVFDERVHTDEKGGKPGLQGTYAGFFNKTLSRSMVIKDLQWKRNGAMAIGVAHYRAITQRSAEDEPVNSAGTLRFEVIKNSAGAMIVGFYHQAAKKQ